jgi:hypothetical protein
MDAPGVPDLVDRAEFDHLAKIHPSTRSLI